MRLCLSVALKHLAAEGDAHEAQYLLGDGGGASDHIADTPTQEGLYLAKHNAIPDGVSPDDSTARRVPDKVPHAK